MKNHQGHEFVSFCKLEVLSQEVVLCVNHFDHLDVLRKVLEQGGAIIDRREVRQYRIRIYDRSIIVKISDVVPKLEANPANRKVQEVWSINAEGSGAIFIHNSSVFEHLGDARSSH